MDFQLTSQYQPTGDQPQAIEQLVAGIRAGEKAQTLLGVTGSGKTFTMANVIEQVGKPTLILSHNKTLAAQLYSEFKGFFPNNSVQYFVSYYDYYQPEAYIPTVDKYIEKDLMINDEIEKLRLSTVSALLSGRKDVVVVSSVSCLYGMGNPEDFDSNVVTVKVGQKITRNKFLRSLVNSLYSRNELELSRGTFRVKGDTVDIRLAYEEIIVRVTFWGDEIESIKTLHPSDNVSLGTHDIFQIYPANLFVTSPERMGSAIGQIELDLGEQYNYFMREAKELEAKRLMERVTYDVEMLREVGHCSGIENYSRYFDGRQPGMRPFCLLDYFPQDFLTIIDESHVTLPQCRAMYGGDLSRKMNLVEYGFRLPAALDNRPLKFEEFERLTPQVLYVSATPADYELEKCEGVVVEQIIRPTGLLDPVIEVRPSLNQIDDLLHEINLRIERDERVLVTTLTKRMAEELNDYLTKIRIKTAYIHSDVDTLDRIRILDGLRAGEFDVLVGVNLLREGLDLPEVSLVAILDADKITDSMQQTIDETSRRRAMQLAYNEEHGITPQAIIKARNSIIGLEADADETADSSRGKQPSRQDSTSKTGRAKSIPYAEEYSTKVNLAADPVIPYLNADALQKLITTKRLEMVEAAKRMDFIDAARLRDEVLAMEERLAKMSAEPQKEESK